MIGIILQARMGSKRFPGKVLQCINGETLLSYQVKRIRKCKLIDELVVATSNKNIDDVIEDECKKLGVIIFRGEEDDVLSRYYKCAKKFNFQTIVRVTGDCPLVDPKIIDEAISLFKEKEVDYCANTIPPSTSMYPDGSDVEVFSFNALKKSFFECSDCLYREHVTFYIWRTSKFATYQMKYKKDCSNLRITVDYKRDLEVINKIDHYLKINKRFGHLDEILIFLENNKKIANINSKYNFGDGWNIDE